MKTYRTGRSGSIISRPQCLLNDEHHRRRSRPSRSRPAPPRCGRGPRACGGPDAHRKTPTRAAVVPRCAARRRRLFRDRGFDATSVSDVARALGLTKAGLYHHFDSKEALLFEIMTFGLDRVRDEVIVPVRGDPRSRGAAAAADRASRTDRDPRAGRSRASGRRDPRACRRPSRKQIEQRMRLYFDLVRDIASRAARLQGGFATST